MTAIINMASVSPWNSKIPGNRRLSDEKDSVVMSSSWSRAGEKSTDGLSMNSNQNIDSSNSQDFNNSKNNMVNHRNFNGNSETEAVDKHNIVSITENPFFKSYGKIRAPHSRNEHRAERERIHSDSSPLSPKVFTESISTSNSLQQQDDEEEVEYHPGSGFVTKLLGKFKMKYEREERAYSQPVPIKRSSSLENILDNERVASSVKPMRSVKNDNVSSVIGQSNLNYRTKSVEHINTSNKPVPGKRAPDVKLARKDIVIIESSKSGKISPTPTPTQSTNHVRSGSVSPTISTKTLRDETTGVDELPKPNTVTNARHIFESSPRRGSKARASPSRPSSATGTRISTVAPTKNTSAPITTTTTSAHSNKPNHSQKPKDGVSAKSTTDVPLPRSTLPPITNRNKKPSPVVTVAPYKPKSDESYSTTTSATIPLPQKPLTTPRSGNVPADKKPLQPKNNQHFISTPRDNKDDKTNQETKSEKILVTPEMKPEVKFPKDSSVKDLIQISDEINPIKTEDSIVTKDEIQNTDISNSIVSEDKVEKNDSQQSGPIKGIPTIIAQRMKKETSPDSVAINGSHVSSQSSNSEHYNSGSNEILSKKRQAPAIPSSSVVTKETKKEVPEKEEISPRQNLHHSKKKTQDIGGPAMVFDSSMVAKKKRKPNYSNTGTTNNTGVPKLDLTGINDNVGRHGYQEGYKPTEIKPCKIVFIGALVDLGRSLLKKDGQSSISKGRIKFNDQAMTLHEYPSELHMLEEYLLKHPEEEELLIVESYKNDIEDEDTPPGTPRNNNDDEVLKSNTALSHSGGLSSYVSKYQSDFDWNDNREPDPIVIRSEPEPEIPKSEELIPAGEDDTNTWSESTTSDLLF